MRTLARLRPSPAMAVALLALFVAMGGVSYAVATIDSSDIVNGSVRSKDIKNETITKADVKLNTLVGKNIANSTIRTEDILNTTVKGVDINNGTIESIDVANGSLNTLDIFNGSLFGVDVADNSLTGADIDEATLGPVNSAVNARTVATVRTIPLTTVAEGGAQTPITTYGPFTITLRCLTTAGTSTAAFLEVNTSEDNSSVSGIDESDTDFDAAESVLNVISLTDPTGGSPAPSATANDSTFSAFAPSGRAFTAHVPIWVNADSGASGECKFHGSFVVSG